MELKALMVLNCLLGIGHAVDITYFHVPKFVNRRDEVTLECHFAMSEPHETLYSVKWYRIDHKGQMEEFYTYNPAKSPPVKPRNLSGIKVDLHRSNVRQVTLRKVTLLTSGMYRCEVTSKLSPAGINSEFREDRMVVLELPDEGPVITGGLPNYQLNDQLELNCTSPKTFPQTILKWYINNKTADKHTIQFEPKRGLKNGLIRTQIGLNLTVSRALFHYGKIHVKCVGIIEEGILHGYTDDDGSSHQILTILLPEKLKWERPPAEFVVNKASASISITWRHLFAMSTLVMILSTAMEFCSKSL